MSAFLGGFMEGLGEGVESSRKRADTNRANAQKFELDKQRIGLDRERVGLARRQVDMQQEKHDIAKQDRLAEKQFKEGWSKAAAEGGWEGSQDYLKGTRPDLWQKMRQQKAISDRSIAEAAGVKLDNSKKSLEVLEKGRDVLAGLGLKIRQSRPEDRAAIYKAAYPVIKSIDPSAPKEYGDDAEIYMQANMGLAMPASKAMAANRSAMKMQSRLGKEVTDLQRAKAAGNKKVADVLEKNIQGKMDNITDARVKEIREKTKDIRTGEDNLRKEYIEQTKQFREKDIALAKVNNITAKGVHNTTPVDQHAIIVSYFKISDGSQVLQSEFEDMAKAESTPNWMKSLIRSHLNGQKASPIIIKQAIDVIKNTHKAHLEQRNKIRDNISAIAVRRGYDVKNVIQDYKIKQVKNKAENLTLELKQMGASKQMQQWAAEAIANGAGPKKVKAAIQKMMEGK